MDVVPDEVLINVPDEELPYRLGARRSTIIGGCGSGGEVWLGTRVGTRSTKQIAHTRKQCLRPSHRFRSVPAVISQMAVVAAHN